MIRNIVMAALLVALGSQAAAQGRPELVPPGWSELERNGQWPGRRFLSPDRSAWLGVYASPPARSPQAFMDAMAYRPGEQITYQRRTRGWIAVSGYKGDRIFYRKSNLACHGTRWHTVELEYPRTDKRKMDALVTHIAHGMNRYGDDCSARPAA
jgi:serine/threonine-protein kinase